MFLVWGFTERSEEILFASHYFEYVKTYLETNNIAYNDVYIIYVCEE